MTKLFPFARVLTVWSVAVAMALCVCLQAQTSVQLPGATPPASSPRRLVDRYCVQCHNERLKIADLRLDRADIENPGAEAEIWEKVVRKVHTGTMPPSNMPQLSQDDRRALLLGQFGQGGRDDELGLPLGHLVARSHGLAGACLW